MEHVPWRRPVVWIATVVVGVGCLVIGFALGQNTVINDRISNTMMGRDLNEAQLRVEQLETELIDAQLTVNVQRAASNALRENMTGEHEKLARLQEEVTFYKNLMSPSSLSEGLQVAELELTQQEDKRVFSYQILLTQVALRRSYIAGDVRIDVSGQMRDGQQDREAVLSLTELTELKKYPLKFRFRYFQDMAGLMTLPDGFVPARVMVTAQQNGKNALQATFPWPEKE